MTIEKMATKVGAPSVPALEAKLVEFGLTLQDCIDNQQYQDDLKVEFASGLAVVGGGEVAPIAPSNVSAIAPVATAEKKGGRMTKAQKLEMQAAQAQTQAASTTTLIDSRAAGAIDVARSQIASIDDLEDGISTFVAGRIVGMDASIAGKVTAIVAEAGDTCVVDLGGITRRSVDAALDKFYAEVS